MQAAWWVMIPHSSPRKWRVNRKNNPLSLRGDDFQCWRGNTWCSPKGKQRKQGIFYREFDICDEILRWTLQRHLNLNRKCNHCRWSHRLTVGQLLLLVIMSPAIQNLNLGLIITVQFWKGGWAELVFLFGDWRSRRFSPKSARLKYSSRQIRGMGLRTNRLGEHRGLVTRSTRAEAGKLASGTEVLGC